MTETPRNTNCEAGARPDLATLLAACLARRRLASSPRPLACDFSLDQARDDVALGLLGCLQHFELMLRQVLLDRFRHQRAQVVGVDRVKLDRDGVGHGVTPSSFLMRARWRRSRS